MLFSLQKKKKKPLNILSLYFENCSYAQSVLGAAATADKRGAGLFLLRSGDGLAGRWVCIQVLCLNKSGKWGLQTSGGVRRSDRTVDLGLCCSTNELQAKLVALVTLVPVVTQNKTPAMPANQGAAPAAKSNLERAVGILKGLHCDVDMHAEL